jgi:putative FmdB family regulatory protein
MPIYEYVCSKCKSKFELLRPMSQASEGVSCPYCHSQAERALSRFACFSKDESGLSSSLDGSSCSSCSSASCDSCGL